MNNSRTEEMRADLFLSYQIEGNRFNHFVNDRHPKTATAIPHSIHIISDLGHMAIPQCILGQVDWEEREDGGLLLCSREEET